MTLALLAAKRRAIATRRTYGACTFNRVRILDEAARSGCPRKLARALACGWTPPGYALIACSASQRNY